MNGWWFSRFFRILADRVHRVIYGQGSGWGPFAWAPGFDCFRIAFCRFSRFLQFMKITSPLVCLNQFLGSFFSHNRRRLTSHPTLYLDLCFYTIFRFPGIQVVREKVKKFAELAVTTKQLTKAQTRGGGSGCLSSFLSPVQIISRTHGHANGHYDPKGCSWFP